MAHSDTLTSETRPTTLVDGLEVEVFTTEEEAASAFAAVPSYVGQQATAFVTKRRTLLANRNRGVWRWHTPFVIVWPIGADTANVNSAASIFGSHNTRRCARAVAWPCGDGATPMPRSSGCAGTAFSPGYLHLGAFRHTTHRLSDHITAIEG